jgi:hypothetical protein
MPAPVAAPLAAPIAGAAVKGAAQGIGAALRYGPGLLQLIDAFRQPGGLGGTVADVPRRQRLAELVEDAVRGAQIAVALPPSPGFPGPGGLGPLGPLMPWDKAARAIAGALGKIAQGWGSAQGPKVTLVTGLWPPLTDYEESFSEPASLAITWTGLRRTTRENCFNGLLAGAVSEPSGTTTREDVISWEASGWMKSEFRSPCGAGLEWSLGETMLKFRYGDGRTENLVVMDGRFLPSSSNEDTTHTEEWAIQGVTLNGEEHLPLVGVALDFPGGLEAWPELEGDPAAKPPIQLDPVSPDIGPVLPPVAGPLPADPAPTDNPEALTDPVPVVPPLPAYTPRPLPGPVLPEFEPEPEADPSRGPGTDRPARPVIPGDRPGPTVPAPVRPFPDVPAEPGVFPDNPPGPGETPNTPPAPGVTPNTPPGPVIDPGVFPQPGPPATPTGPDGNPAVPDTDTTTDTPTDQHTPVAGDDPVTGNGPAPTLQAMAREMGRQEQKLGRLLERVGNPNRPTGPGVDPPSIPDLLGLLRQVLELLGSIDGAGAYEISSPCNVDPATGEPVPPLRAEWGGSIGLERNILKRVDALAELVQHHKDLPQPICRGPRPTGEHVTVNFEQVPDDLEAPA